MGKKITYGLYMGTKDVGGDDAQSDHKDNLPKQTRRLLLQLQVAESERDLPYVNTLLETLGDLYQDTDDISKTLEIAKKELNLADVLEDTSEALKTQTRCKLLNDGNHKPYLTESGNRFPYLELSIDWVDAIGGREKITPDRLPDLQLTQKLRRLEQFDTAINYTKRYIVNAERLEDGAEQLEGLIELALTHIAKWEDDQDRQQTDDQDIRDAMEALKKGSTLISYVSKERRDSVRADLNLNIGITFRHANDMTKAVKHFTKALEAYKTQKNRPFEARAYFNLAMCFQDMDNAELTLKNLNNELKIWQELGDLNEQARTYMEIAARCQRFCRYDEAIAASKQCIGLSEKIDDKDARCKAQLAVRKAQECIGKQAQVEALTDTCAQLRKMSDASSNRRLFDICGERGNLLLELRQWGDALKDFYEQKRIGYTLKVPKRKVEEILVNLGDCLTEEKRYPDAIRCYREGLERFEGTQEERLQVLLRLGKVLIAHGESYDPIARIFEEALSLGQRISDLESQRMALLQLEWAAMTHHHPGKARSYQNQLTEVEALIEASGAGSQGTSSLEQDFLTADDESGATGSGSERARSLCTSNFGKPSRVPYTKQMFVTICHRQK
ncbi:hypothetical protein HKX48_001376 [Thoreauomyces humboldtii]|nr:hypothetical protein HKX48_001376 [Thoreauomyces humboldtii]